MKMNMKSLLALLLVVVMTVSVFAGCSKPADDTKSTTAPAAAPTEGTEPAGPVLAADAMTEVDPEAYEETSGKIYNEILGEFMEHYEVALAEINDLDKRMALMAIAEAKLMESAVVLPIQSQGGNYAISRVAPHTTCTTDWGVDEYRYNEIVIANEIIKIEDRNALNALYGELAGTGTYAAEAKKYLTEHGYTIKDVYDYTYATDPLTWDWLASSRTTTGEPCAPAMEGLLRYNNEGMQMPALATEYTISEDGLTITFKIREGVKWVDYQGRELDDVQADDWVAGLQHAVDTAGGLGDLLSGVVLNLDKYIAGEITDFAEVGVKAVDKYTLQYTLAQPTAWFISMTGYNALAPMCRSYYESQGGKFGAEYDATGVYGTDPEHIPYCGAFLVSNWTEKNIISYTANPSYWDAANVSVKAINLKYNDGSDVTKAYEDMKSGVLDGTGLNANVIESAKTEKPDGEDQTYFDLYHYNSRTTATCFFGFFNLNRHSFHNFNDASAVVSTQTVDDAARTNAAVKNVHFRRALNMGLDRGTYMAQTVGEELKYSRMINSYVPGTFQTLGKEVTVDINGTPTTFPAGTSFGAIEQAQLDADGMKIKVWDPTADSGAGSGAQFDGWYNPENAKEEMALAVAELAEQGVEVSAENPIQIDYMYYSSAPISANRAQVVKQSIEASTDGCIQINLVDTVTDTVYEDSSYNAEVGYDNNYDWCDSSGWGPDYGDAQTYLDTFLPEWSGYMTKILGIY